MNEWLAEIINYGLTLTCWYWFALAAILLVIELLIGGGFLFWVGIAALFDGIIVWAFHLPWPYQMLVFCLLAVVVSVSWWKYLQRNPLQTDKPMLNRRSEQYIGRIFTLQQPIVNGRGSVKVDDSSWIVNCTEDYPAGTKIKIIGVDGTILQAEKTK